MRAVGRQALHQRGHLKNRFHAVVHEKHLALPLHFLHDRRLNQRLVESGDGGLDGQAAARRGLNHRKVAQTAERHVQGAGNGCGGHGQHIDAGFEFLQLFLGRHAEALLLIHDQQAQIAQVHVFGKQAVRADQDVHPARLRPRPRFSSARRRSESG